MTDVWEDEWRVNISNQHKNHNPEWQDDYLDDYWEADQPNLNKYRDNRKDMTRDQSNQFVTKQSYDKTNEELDLFKDMSNQFKLMVNNNEFSDFTFLVNGMTYFGHKTILASRSPVFAAMFRSNMKESLLNNAVINDIECDVFEEFLKYLYCGQTAKFSQIAAQLLPVSDRYHVFSLKTQCEKYCTLDIKNAISVLVMSHKYSAKKLMDRAVDFILKNLQAIRSEFADEWIQFIKDWPELANSLFAAIKSVNSVHCQ